MIDCYVQNLCDLCGSEKCGESCIIRQYYNKVINESNIPPQYIHADDIKLVPQNEFDYTQFRGLSQVRANIEEFVANGKCLYIYSPTCGNGKTTWACKLAVEYIYSLQAPVELPVKFVNVQSMLSLWKARFTDEYDTANLYKLVDDLKRADLVILDDLGITSATESDIAVLFDIIDFRTTYNKSCIFTSNNVPSMLVNKLGDRLANRIIGYSRCVGFKSNYAMRKEK